MIIYRGDTEILNLVFNPEGKERCELMVEHSVSISFELSDYVKLEKGDSITHNGKVFSLNKDYQPTVNKQTGGYKYDLSFYDLTERFKDFKIKYSLQGVDELEFKLSTSGDRFLDVVIYSLNKHGLGLFVKGVYPAEIKEIHFQNISIFEALNAIAEAYELEWWISDGVLNIGKLEFGVSKLLRDDVELDDISFSQSSENLITRLYAFGSTRNLPLDYRITGAPVDNIAERRLRLPGIPYVDLFDSLPENQIIEGVQVFEDIYPRQKNTIIGVETHLVQGDNTANQDTTIFTIEGDNTFTITEDNVVSGQPLGIAFQTGYLAGREFDLIIRESNKFEIKYSQDGNVYIPNATLKPQIGDEFFFFNFKAEAVLPNLIVSAENELKAAAREFLDKIGSEYVYTCKTRSIKCEESNIDLQIGQVVTIQSNYLGDITSRVRAFEKDIYNKFECEYTIGDYSQYSRLSEIEGKIKDSVGSTGYRIGGLDGKYLRKDIEDNAHKQINFLQGIASKKVTSPTYIPGMLGEGYSVDEFGNAVFESITGRTYLSIPELRFNRINIYTGIRWQTFGAGLIESVEIDKDAEGNNLDTGTIILKLEDGEYGAIADDDLCQGIFHNFNGANDAVNEDQKNGNFRFSGFNTSYFRIISVEDTTTNGVFRYQLRDTSRSWTQRNHPQAQMNFACYANPYNKNRQACTYSTTEYTIQLQDMIDWEYGESNIYGISGKLKGFKMGDTILNGHGNVVGNAYIYGVIQNIEKVIAENIEVGGKNLLREYALQFGGKYWGGGAEWKEIDVDLFLNLPSSEDDKFIATEDNILIEL